MSFKQKGYLSKKIENIITEVKLYNQYMKDNNKSFFLRIIGSFVLILKELIFLFLFNPIVVGVVAALLFGRIYDFGLIMKKGSNVRITGQCEMKNGVVRGDLVQDVAVIASSNKEYITAVLVATRDWVKCEHSKASIDPYGTSKDLFRLNVNIPTPLDLVKHEEIVVIDDFYEKFVKKEVVITGDCIDKQGKSMTPFTDQVASITQVKKSKEDPSLHIISGILKNDGKLFNCLSTNVGKLEFYKEPQKQKLEEKTNKPIIKSNVGETVIVSGICFPNSDVYGPLIADGKKPTSYRSHYNLTDNPVKIIKESVNQETGKIESFYGAIITPNKDLNGAKIICNALEQDILIQEMNENVKINETTKK